jgi:hypothetical protein
VSSAPTPPNGLGGGTLCDWYRADDIAVADGAVVLASDVVDASGNGHTFNNQASNVKHVAGGPPGRTWIQAGYFTNSSGSSPVPTGDATYFGIILSGSSGNQGIMGSVANNDGAYLRLGAFKLAFFGNSVGGGGGASTITIASGTWTPFIMTYATATGSTTWQVGSSSETVAGTVGKTFRSPGTSRAIGVESFSGGLDSVFSGGWSELGRYSSVLSSGDLTALWAYLTT